MSEDKKDYLKNKVMLEELDRCAQTDEISEKLGEMFMLLSERCVGHRNFCRYPYREDLIATGILACVKAWRSFDSEKSNNPFSFFTTCIMNSFIHYIKHEYKNSNAINAIKEEHGLDPDFGYQDMKKNEQEAEQATGVEDELDSSNEAVDIFGLEDDN